LRLVGLCGAWSAEALAAPPEVDFVLTLPFPGFVRGATGGGLWRPYALAFAWARRLRSQLKPEFAVILRPDHYWGALLAKLAGIPVRIGYDLPDVAPSLTERVPFRPAHSATLSARLVERWTGPLRAADLPPYFPVAEEDRAHAANLLADLPAALERPPVIIHPGAGTAIKAWPAEKWAYTADLLAERLNAAVVFTGSDREHRAIGQIMAAMRRPNLSVAGETNLSQLAALYGRAAVVLGPDTGPLHLAVAAGAPTVHLFGPADPAEFAPLGDPARQIVLSGEIGCRPCRILDWSGDDAANHPCVREIALGRVVEAALAAAARR
jgi:heptosyltransferase-2/heptosyltransferase-3